MPQERRELMAAEFDAFLQLQDLFARRGQRLLGLLHLETGIQSRRVPIARERSDLRALLQRGVGDVEQQIGTLELDVGVRNGGREGEPRCRGVHLARLRKPQCALRCV